MAACIKRAHQTTCRTTSTTLQASEIQKVIRDHRCRRYHAADSDKTAGPLGQHRSQYPPKHIHTPRAAFASGLLPKRGHCRILEDTREAHAQQIPFQSCCRCHLRRCCQLQHPHSIDHTCCVKHQCSEAGGALMSITNDKKKRGQECKLKRGCGRATLGTLLRTARP